MSMYNVKLSSPVEMSHNFFSYSYSFTNFRYVCDGDFSTEPREMEKEAGKLGGIEGENMQTASGGEGRKSRKNF